MQYDPPTAFIHNMVTNLVKIMTIKGNTNTQREDVTSDYKYNHEQESLKSNNH